MFQIGNRMPLMKHPGAFIPLMMSAAALMLVLGYVAVYGAVTEADEGAAAHTFQLLIALQAPIMGFFLWQWLRKDPRRALEVLAVQVGGVAAALGVLYFSGLG